MALILVVEPDDTILDFITFVLKLEGHDSLKSANGAEAVALYRSLATRIDLVLTALQMPVMDGHQTILRIRMTRKDAKIVCMTEDQERAPDGMLSIHKPLTVEALKHCVDQALRQPVFKPLTPQKRGTEAA